MVDSASDQQYGRDHASPLPYDSSSCNIVTGTHNFCPPLIMQSAAACEGGGLGGEEIRRCLLDTARFARSRDVVVAT